MAVTTLDCDLRTLSLCETTTILILIGSKLVQNRILWCNCWPIRPVHSKLRQTRNFFNTRKRRLSPSLSTYHLSTSATLFLNCYNSFQFSTQYTNMHIVYLNWLSWSPANIWLRGSWDFVSAYCFVSELELETTPRECCSHDEEKNKRYSA